MTSRSAVIDAGMDLQTARVVKVAQAISLSELVPPATGRRLVRCARSARLFTEAMEYRAAFAALDELVALIPDDEPEFAVSRDCVVRAIERAKRAIGFVSSTSPQPPVISSRPTAA